MVIAWCRKGYMYSMFFIMLCGEIRKKNLFVDSEYAAVEKSKHVMISLVPD